MCIAGFTVTGTEPKITFFFLPPTLKIILKVSCLLVLLKMVRLNLGAVCLCSSGTHCELGFSTIGWPLPTINTLHADHSGKTDVKPWCQNCKTNLVNRMAICWHCLSFLWDFEMTHAPMLPTSTAALCFCFYL